MPTAVAVNGDEDDGPKGDEEPSSGAPDVILNAEPNEEPSGDVQALPTVSWPVLLACGHREHLCNDNN